MLRETAAVHEGKAGLSGRQTNGGRDEKREQRQPTRTYEPKIHPYVVQSTYRRQTQLMAAGMYAGCVARGAWGCFPFVSGGVLLTLCQCFGHSRALSDPGRREAQTSVCAAGGLACRLVTCCPVLAVDKVSDLSVPPPQPVWAVLFT